MFCSSQTPLSTTLQWADNKQKNKERREAERRQSCQLNSDETNKIVPWPVWAVRDTEGQFLVSAMTLQSCIRHMNTHITDRKGSHNMSSLCLSQGHVPETHSQSDCRLNASGAIQADEIKLSQSYFSRWKRNLRCMLGLDARNRIPGQATGNSICVLKGKLEQVSQKPTDEKRNSSFF